MDAQKELQSLHESFREFKTANETALEEIKKFGKVSGDLEAKMTEISTAMDGHEKKLNDRITEVEAKATAAAALEKKIEELETEFRSKGAGAGSEAQAKQAAEQEAAMRKSVFWKLTRKGVSHDNLLATPVLSDEEKSWVTEKKGLIVSDDTQGGYLAPEEYVVEIISDAVEFSPIRSISRIRTTSQKAVNIPKKTGSTSATWVEETGTRSESTTPTFGVEKLESFEMHGLLKVSRQELEDSAFNIEAFIREELAEQFGVAEGTAFVSGDSVGQPQGILSNANVASVANGDANNLQADGLIDLYFEPKEVYLTNATWVMSRSTLKEIRKLKDANGQYLWEAGIKTEARPATILDRPYLVCTDMPAATSGNYPIAFGDFRRAYYVLDRVVMEIMTDPYTSKGTGMIEISARKRVGGRVVLAEAIKTLQMA